MKRFTLSISAISLTSLGLLLASACSTDDSTSDGEGGYVGSGGNTYMNRGGGTGYGGTTGNGGAAAVGGKAATGGAIAVGGKAATGGAANGGAATGGKAATGGAATAGNAGNGGTAGAATAGNAGDGATAGSTSTGGVATAGNAGKLGTAGSTSTAGKTSVAGSTSSGGTANAGTAGKTNTGTAGNAGAGTAGSGPACATDSTPPANGFCTPPASLAAIPNMTGTIGNYHVNSTPGSARIYNVGSGITTTPVDGDFFTGSPFTAPGSCQNAGVNASASSGMSVTVTNNLGAPVDVLLYVIDQTGTTAPYTIVTLTAKTTIAANATNSTVQVPFVGATSQFVGTCTYSSAIALNLATVRQVGIGFDSANNQVDVWLLGMAFY